MRSLILSALCLCLMSTAPCRAEVLTGDTRLACEATLCLSSGMRPGECGPSLNRYFGINLKEWGDTLQARKNFLNLCPSNGAPGMPSLVDSIVNAAGQCDAKHLNRALAYQVEIKVCDEDRFWLEPEERCYIKTITVIGDRLPSHCRAYFDHQYTWKVSARYEGTVMEGGKWVDELP